MDDGHVVHKPLGVCSVVCVCVCMCMCIRVDVSGVFDEVIRGDTALHWFSESTLTLFQLCG